MIPRSAKAPKGAPDPAPVDVCLIVEGCYPFVAGGVSSWLDWLMRNQPGLRFGVVALTADERPRASKYERPDNLAFVEVLPLARVTGRPGFRQPVIDRARMADDLCAVMTKGDPEAFRDLIAITSAPAVRAPFPRLGGSAPPTYAELLGSPDCWDVLVEVYGRICPTASFPDFFWAWRSLVGGLFSVLTFPLPEARAYHAISTGYAGLLAARAALATGAGAAITEHGIYCNERRIDLVVADWMADTLPPDLSCRDTRRDIRAVWTDTFEAFARIAYASADRVTTLYGANTLIQKSLGAPQSKLRVIPNGIELDRFDGIRRAEDRPRQTVALIGRVVPIKDIETFIAAAAEIRRAAPEVSVLIIGPTDEDEEYHELCRRQVADLGLEGTVHFTGKMNILDVLPEIDVMVLSSISEAQPLVLLEAGAARIPCVTTDVGSCREIIEGTPDESPPLGHAGRVVPPMDAQALAAAVLELLHDDALRHACGAALRARVEARFTSARSAESYAALYRELGVT